MAELNRKDLAEKVWRRMFDFLIRSRPQRDHVLSRLGLNPNDARALSDLDARAGRSMQSLAEQWDCDASNVTGIVDRLERLRLAERRLVPADRRVKHVVLTPHGVRTKAALMSGTYQPPTELLALDRTALEELAAALDRLP